MDFPLIEEGNSDPGLGILVGLVYEDFHIFDLKRIGLVSVLSILNIDTEGLLVHDLRLILDKAISNIITNTDDKAKSWMQIIDDFNYEEFSTDKYLFKRKSREIKVTGSNKAEEEEDLTSRQHIKDETEKFGTPQATGPTSRHYRSIKEKLLFFHLEEGTKFNGQSKGEVRVFLLKIEKTMIAHALSFPEVKEIFPFLIGSKVRPWIENHINNWTSFDQCKSDMEDAFLSVGWQEELESKIYATFQLKGESVVLFTSRIIQMNNQMIDKLSTRRLIFCIYSNLLPFFRQHIFLEDCITVEDIIRHGKKVETTVLASQAYYLKHPEFTARSKFSGKDKEKKQCSLVDAKLSKSTAKCDVACQTSFVYCFGCGLFGQKRFSCWNCKNKAASGVRTSTSEN